MAIGLLFTGYSLFADMREARHPFQRPSLRLINRANCVASPL